MSRELNMTIDLDTEKNVFEIMIGEPESGESFIKKFAFNPAKHKSFNEEIGNEIYSWLCLWADEDSEVRNIEPDEVCESCMVEQNDVSAPITEPADNQFSEEGYEEPFPTW